MKNRNVSGNILVTHIPAFGKSPQDLIDSMQNGFFTEIPLSESEENSISLIMINDVVPEGHAILDLLSKNRSVLVNIKGGKLTDIPMNGRKLDYVGISLRKNDNIPMDQEETDRLYLGIQEVISIVGTWSRLYIEGGLIRGAKYAGGTTETGSEYNHQVMGKILSEIFENMTYQDIITLGTEIRARIVDIIINFMNNLSNSEEELFLAREPMLVVA